MAAPDDDGPRYCEAGQARPILPWLWAGMRRLGGGVPESPPLVQLTEDQHSQALLACLLGDNQRVHPQAVLAVIDAVVRWCDEQTAPSPLPAPEHPVGRIAFGPDHRSWRWGDVEFSFTPTQAAAVAILWEARNNGTPEVGETTVLEHAGSAMTGRRDRLRDLFTSGGKLHPAWGTMIVPGRSKGTV